MWGQLIIGHLKPGRDEDLPRLIEHLRATQPPGSGFVRSTAMRDQNDPSRVYLLVVVESEEKARTVENDPRHLAEMETRRATMAEIFDARPEFFGLTFVDEWSGL